MHTAIRISSGDCQGNESVESMRGLNGTTVLSDGIGEAKGTSTPLHNKKCLLQPIVWDHCDPVTQAFQVFNATKL